jgi:hypothetical protein
MTKRMQDLLGYVLGIAILVVITIGVYTSKPELPHSSEWIRGGMNAPQDALLVAVWINRDGSLVSGVVERIGDGFYEDGPEGQAVGAYGGPPDWWTYAPRGKR